MEPVIVQPKDKEELKALIEKHIEDTNPKEGDIVDLNWIDTGKITDMSELFKGRRYNFNVSNWDVSKVKDMSRLFGACMKFNCDLSAWDVSSVEDMS